MANLEWKDVSSQLGDYSNAGAVAIDATQYAGTAIKDAMTELAKLYQDKKQSDALQYLSAMRDPNNPLEFNKYIDQAIGASTGVGSEFLQYLGGDYRNLQGALLDAENLRIQKEKGKEAQNAVDRALADANIAGVKRANAALEALNLRTDARTYGDVDPLLNSASQRAVQGARAAQIRAKLAEQERAQLQQDMRYPVAMMYLNYAGDVSSDTPEGKATWANIHKALIPQIAQRYGITETMAYNIAMQGQKDAEAMRVSGFRPVPDSPLQMTLTGSTLDLYGNEGTFNIPIDARAAFQVPQARAAAQQVVAQGGTPEQAAQVAIQTAQQVKAKEQAEQVIQEHIQAQQAQQAVQQAQAAQAVQQAQTQSAVQTQVAQPVQPVQLVQTPQQVAAQQVAQEQAVQEVDNAAKQAIAMKQQGIPLMPAINSSRTALPQIRTPRDYLASAEATQGIVPMPLKTAQTEPTAETVDSTIEQALPAQKKTVLNDRETARVEAQIQDLVAEQPEIFRAGLEDYYRKVYIEGEDPDKAGQQLRKKFEKIDYGGKIPGGFTAFADKVIEDSKKSPFTRALTNDLSFFDAISNPFTAIPKAFFKSDKYPSLPEKRDYSEIPYDQLSQKNQEYLRLTEGKSLDPTSPLAIFTYSPLFNSNYSNVGAWSNNVMIEENRAKAKRNEDLDEKYLQEAEKYLPPEERKQLKLTRGQERVKASYDNLLITSSELNNSIANAEVDPQSQAKLGASFTRAKAAYGDMRKEVESLTRNTLEAQGGNPNKNVTEVLQNVVAKTAGYTNTTTDSRFSMVPGADGKPITEEELLNIDDKELINRWTKDKELSDDEMFLVSQKFKDLTNRFYKELALNPVNGWDNKALIGAKKLALACIDAGTEVNGSFKRFFWADNHDYLEAATDEQANLIINALNDPRAQLKQNLLTFAQVNAQIAKSQSYYEAMRNAADAAYNAQVQASIHGATPGAAAYVQETKNTYNRARTNFINANNSILGLITNVH